MGSAKNFLAYKRLLSDERCQLLIEMFRHENQKIFQFSSQSAFSACLQTGIAAHKTPYCKKQLNSNCIICSKLFELAEGLPNAHASISRYFLIFFKIMLI